MNQLTIILLVLLNAANAFAQREGGMSGGGGGTIDGAPVPMETVMNTIASARPVIFSAFATHETEFLNDPSGFKETQSYFAKLFSGTPTVFDVLPLLQVIVKLDSPCFDFDGNEVDASVNTGIKYGICISAKRIQAKVNSFNYQGEIPALMAHEISHLLGTTEEEAVAIQTNLIPGFQIWDALIANFYRSAAYYNQSAQQRVVAVIQNLKNGQAWSCNDIQNLYTSMSSLVVWHGSFYALMTPFPQNLLVVREADLEEATQTVMQLEAFRDYFCSLPGGGASEQDQKKYTNNFVTGFGNAQVVSALDYSANANHWGNVLSDLFVNLQIRRWPSVTQTLSDLQALADQFGAIALAISTNETAQFPIIQQ